MWVVCSPAFAAAFRALSYQSRRQFLRSAGAAATGAFSAEPVGRALADGSVNEALEGGLETSAATIFVARRIITMERDNPSATAVAIAGDKILAAGSLDQVKSALANRPYRIDATFADKVVLPGLIDQHLHPVLGALTLAVEVIAPCARSASRPPIRGAGTTRSAASRPGKIANFTLLDDNPYAVEPIKLKDIAVWGTVFEGALYPVERG
jgi:hypothetical protein